MRYESIVCGVMLTVASVLMVPTRVLASPGAPDGNRHPYVGLMVVDEGDGQLAPYCQITLISSTEAVIANHCASALCSSGTGRGEQITFTLDNPVVFPASLITGTVRFGGWDFGDYEVDVAIVDLDTPVDLPRYAQLPPGLLSYGPGEILDYVTYVGLNRAALHSRGFHGQGLSWDTLQNEPAHVDFDRNVQRTTTVQGSGQNGITVNDPTKSLVTMNVACFGNSGSPIFLKGTDVLAGVLSSGGYWCLGGGDTIFARTDNELALGILTGTVTPPPPPPPTCEEVCAAEAQQVFDDCIASGGDVAFCEDVLFDFYGECIAQCGPSCEDQCSIEAFQLFDDCVASGENPVVCDWLTSQYFLECYEQCQPQPDCVHECFDEAFRIFDECIASGEDPVACDALANEQYDSCFATCLSCEDACLFEASQLFDDCVASGEDPDLCGVLANDHYEQCVATCD